MNARSSKTFFNVMAWPILFLLLTTETSEGNALSADKCSPASYSIVKQAHYPLADLFHHITGTAVIRVTVGVDGIPEEWSVNSSSGHDSLDQAALAAIREYRFNPKKCDGKAVGSTALVPFAFNRKDFDPASTKFQVDDTPLEFDEIGQEVAYLRLRRDTDVRTNAEGDVFFDMKKSLLWIVRKAPDGKDSEVVRVRAEERGDNFYELYTVACSGAENWCANQLEFCLNMVQSDPLMPTTESSKP
jgi:TonB family protein